MESIRCSLDSFEEAIGAMLQNEARECRNAMAKGIDKTMNDMVKETKRTAPRSKLDRSGTFAKKIAWRVEPYGFNGHSARWYVKPPDYRLTHLLVHGHATRDGGRTKANPFLHNALENAERALEENIRREIEGR